MVPGIVTVPSAILELHLREPIKGLPEPAIFFIAEDQKGPDQVARQTGLFFDPPLPHHGAAEGAVLHLMHGEEPLQGAFDPLRTRDPHLSEEYQGPHCRGELGGIARPLRGPISPPTLGPLQLSNWTIGKRSSIRNLHLGVFRVPAQDIGESLRPDRWVFWIEEPVDGLRLQGPCPPAW